MEVKLHVWGKKKLGETKVYKKEEAHIYRSMKELFPKGFNEYIKRMRITTHHWYYVLFMIWHSKLTYVFLISPVFYIIYMIEVDESY